LSEQAIAWWRKAGDLALRRSAFGEAIAHLDKAAGLAAGLADGPEPRLLQLRLQVVKGNALIAARGHHAYETTAAFARARELAAGIENAPERFSICYGLRVGSLTRAELRPMQEMAEVFLNDADRRPGSPEAGIAHRSYSMTRWFEGDFIGARKHCEHVLTIYNSERDRELSYRFGQDYGLTAMSFLALVLWPLGEVDRSRLLAEDAVARTLQDGHVPTLYLVRNVITASLEMMRGDTRRAIPHLEASLNLAREHGMQLPLLTSTFGLAWARWHAGLGEDRAELEMRQRRQVIRSSHYRFLEPLYAKLLADVEAGTGHAERALGTVDDALSDAHQTGQKWFDAELHRVRGELLLQHSPGAAGAIEASFVRAIEVARSQQTRAFELRAALSLARFYQKTGREADASKVLVPALLGFGEGPELPEVAEAGRLLPSIGEGSVTAA
jgi:hypothetical protein